MGGVKSLWAAYLLSAAMQFGLLTFPSISAIKANLVSEAEQGKLQGALSGAQSLGGSFGPLLFSAVYKATTHSSGVAHGSAWFVGAGVTLLALAISLILPE